MVMQNHVLLISEDDGNQAALLHARNQLEAGGRVTWICSTPTSAALTALEDITALKNAHLATLNLLVITRQESQPFAVLTGELDGERLTRCADLLFDRADVDACTIATPGRLTESVENWLTQHMPETSVSRLDLAPPPEQAPTTSDPALQKAANTVAVTVVLQGREIHFSMLRTAGTLLDGAEDAGLDLPFSCRGGVCSTCRTRLRDGEVELMENYALEDWELDAGFTLPCQAEPISDKITLDYDEV